MGKVTFDQGVGVGGISTIDDKTPSAYEEVWDNLDAVTTDENGLVGGGNSGVFVYSNTVMGSAFSAQVGKGGSANNADNGNTEGASGSSIDFALTNQSLMDGLDVGIGYGLIQNGLEGGEDEDEHMVAYVTYSMGGFTVVYTQSAIDEGDAGGQNEYAMGWSVADNLMEAVSYTQLTQPTKA